MPKWMGAPSFYYDLKLMCAVDSYNWQKGWKDLSEGVVRKSKYHKFGMLVRQQKKHVIEKWRTDLVRKVLQPDIHTQECCDEQDTTLTKAAARRAKWKRENDQSKTQLAHALRATAVGVTKKRIAAEELDVPEKPRPELPWPFTGRMMMTRSETDALKQIQRILVSILPTEEEQAVCKDGGEIQHSSDEEGENSSDSENDHA